MKKVLVPLAVSTDNKNLVSYFVRPTYLKALIAHDIMPILVGVEYPADKLKAIYNSCKGVLIMGGWDVNPKFYGQKPHRLTQVAEPQRDELELTILEWLKKDNKPYLGICRGAQILNIAFGGTLKQHLSEETTEPHSVGSYAALGEITHEIRINPQSLLFEILQTERAIVNSGHHQAVNQLAPGLKVAANTNAGIVEAVEGEDKKRFLLGVQWHPEAENSPTSEKIFTRFAQSLMT